MSRDLHSLSDFKRNTTQFVDRMRGSGEPLVLTTKGQPQLAVQDAAAYQKLIDRVEALEALDGIQRGFADVEAARTTPLRQFESEFRTQRGLPSRPR